MIPFPKFLGNKVSITYVTKAVLRNFKTNLNSNIILFVEKITRHIKGVLVVEVKLIRVKDFDLKQAFF